MDTEDEDVYRRGLNDQELLGGVDTAGPAVNLDTETPAEEDAYYRRYLNDNKIPEVET